MKSHDSGNAVSNGRDRPSEDDALLRVAEGTAGETGERFFRSLVDHLRSALGTMGAWVATLDDGGTSLRAISMRMRDEWLDGIAYPVDGTPCKTALEERRAFHVPERLIEDRKSVV